MKEQIRINQNLHKKLKLIKELLVA